MNNNVTIEAQIEAAIKQRRLEHERWQKEEADVEKEANKMPSWWLKPGVTKIVYNGRSVAFSRKGGEPFMIADIKKCDPSSAFEFTKKYKVTFSYPTHGGKEGGGYQFYDGTEMSVMVSSPAYEREQNEQEEKMREELGC